MNAGETGSVMVCARIASISLRLASSTCQPSISSSGSSCSGRRAPPERNRRSLVENPSYGERAPRHQAREMAEYYLTVPFPSRPIRP